MWHVLALTEGNRLEKLTVVPDAEVARTIARDHGRARAFDGDLETEPFVAEVKEWMKSEGLSEEEMNKSARDYTLEVFASFREFASKVAAVRPPVNSLIFSLIEAVAGPFDQNSSPAEMHGVVGLDGVRISRESCGPCHACGAVAASHKDCMEPDGDKCCPEPFCEACGVAVVAGETAAQMADHYRHGPVSILATLRGLFVRAYKQAGSSKEIKSAVNWFLDSRTPIDPRLSDEKSRPAMAALARALHERANSVTKFLSSDKGD